ncbi:MAG: hypothetical protein A2289_01935 [Deltaproteobacteria bacterium RIFOXYA12_FULL_58_15]|nr:MAG: hypothetical protein A2289_01935 [Deltaproteobacteria bacterium RIFOXYA12_FULL_58_15]OGR14617.1 MAG: hypothetical protein A2341_07600 [Deltaproteobacteria bacterium RIFOXYB12_FULL_58_9]
MVVAMSTPERYTAVMAFKTSKPVTVRKKLGMSQRQFAQMLGIGLRTVTNWEQGLREPAGPARALLCILDREPKAAMSALGYAPAKVTRKGRA